jgi:ectoine hydroxylase-related dioxygenase (phytanoyl-CoA dioxygenase family)
VSALSQLEEDGFAVIPGVLPEAQCRVVESHLAGLGTDIAGTRNLLDADWCVSMAAMLRSSDYLAPILADSVAVQCTYFDKSPSVNWLVPIHQDLSIPVQKRVAHSELRGWAEKEGSLFVQPPPSVLEALIAIRLHIDDSGPENGPLRVIPGSHRSGRLLGADQATLRANRTEFSCTTPRGGVVAMKPLLLHASSKSASPRPRRVLHYLYGPLELPFGLGWCRAA